MKTRLIIFLLAVIVGETLNQFAEAAIGDGNDIVIRYQCFYIRAMLVIGYSLLAVILFVQHRDRPAQQPRLMR